MYVNDFCDFNSVLTIAILKPLRSKPYLWFHNIQTDNEHRRSIERVSVFSAPIRGSNPGDFYLFQNLHTGSGAHLDSYSMCTRFLSLRKKRPEREVDRSLPFRSKTELYFFRPCAFMAWTETTLSLPLPVAIFSNYHRSRYHFPVVCLSLRNFNIKEQMPTETLVWTIICIRIDNYTQQKI